MANVVVPQIANVLVPAEEITKKVNEVIAKYVDTSAINLNKLIDGSSIKCPNPAKAIANSRSRKTDKWIGFKNDINCFSSSIKNAGRYIESTESTIIDESIEEYEYHECVSITGTSLNNGGDVRISIESQDVFTHSSESYLIFEGRLTKADGIAYVSADEVGLTNNAIMHLFSRIEYHLSNQLMESINYPGQATTKHGLLKYPDDFSKAQGLNQLWYRDTATTAVKADNNGFCCKACISNPVTNRQRYIFF